MAADGSGSGNGSLKEGVVWSKDPTVLRVQEFAYGYGPSDTPTTVDQIYLQLPWYRETKKTMDRALRMTRCARKENCARGQGPSRAGKTSTGRALLREHMPWRDDDGLHMPWGYTRVAAVPSIKVVGQQVLRSLGDPSWAQNRSPVQRLARIGEVAEMVGLDALIIDDLHHLVDARGRCVQHAVADFFIDMGDETGVPFLFLGLERMDAVFRVNEQLRGRTGTPIEYLRLDWRKDKHRDCFNESLSAITRLLAQTVKFDESMNDPTLGFRLYCSCGGLVGYLILIIRVAEYESRKRRVPLGFGVLRKAVADVVAKPVNWPGRKDPFHPDFVAKPTAEALRIASNVGIGFGPKEKQI